MEETLLPADIFNEIAKYSDKASICIMFFVSKRFALSMNEKGYLLIEKIIKYGNLDQFLWATGKKKCDKVCEIAMCARNVEVLYTSRCHNLLCASKVATQEYCLNECDYSYILRDRKIGLLKFLLRKVEGNKALMEKLINYAILDNDLEMLVYLHKLYKSYHRENPNWWNNLYSEEQSKCIEYINGKLYVTKLKAGCGYLYFK